MVVGKRSVVFLSIIEYGCKNRFFHNR